MNMYAYEKYEIFTKCLRMIETSDSKHEYMLTRYLTLAIKRLDYVHSPVNQALKVDIVVRFSRKFGPWTILL